jgi:hypothetical protein
MLASYKNQHGATKRECTMSSSSCGMQEEEESQTAKKK